MYKRKTPKPPVELNSTIDQVVQWKKIIKATYRLALGGLPVKNQYGVDTVTKPDIGAIRLLMEFRFGRPDTRITDSRADVELLDNLKKFADRYVLPSGHVSVDDKGEVVEEVQQ